MVTRAHLPGFDAILCVGLDAGREIPELFGDVGDLIGRFGCKDAVKLLERHGIDIALEELALFISVVSCAAFASSIRREHRPTVFSTPLDA